VEENMVPGYKHKSDPALISLLAAGNTVPDTAKLVGVPERTIYRRLEDSDFIQKIDETRDAITNRATAVLTGGSAEAATVLCSLLKSESESIRLESAKTLLDLALRWRESCTLLERIVALEEVNETAC
jgi:hypothetical protein